MGGVEASAGPTPSRERAPPVVVVTLERELGNLCKGGCSGSVLLASGAPSSDMSWTQAGRRYRTLRGAVVPPGSGPVSRSSFEFKIARKPRFGRLPDPYRGVWRRHCLAGLAVDGDAHRDGSPANACRTESG